MGDGDVFKLDRADPFAAGFDNVLGSVADRHIAVAVQRRHIAGCEPAILQKVLILHLEIAVQHPVTAHHQIALGLAVMGQIIAVIVDDLQLDPKGRAPLVFAQAVLLLDGQVAMLGQGKIGRAKRAHLAHAPGVDSIDAISFPEGLDHRRRTGRAADHGAFQAGQF